MASATVVIPTYQRPDLLALCLDALDRALAEVPAASVDVVVSDDSRDDASRELVQARFPWVHYVQGPRRGPACNRNHGAATATAPWLMFIDDDCIPDPSWLAAYLQAFSEHPGQELFEGLTRADRARRSFAEEAPINESGGYLWSCNMAISTSLFRRLQGFCESFPHPALEDVEFRLRLERDGQHAIFVRRASVCHPYRPRRALGFVHKHNVSYVHLLDLHPELAQAMSWSGIVLNTARMLKAVARGAWRYGPAGTGRVAYSVFSKAVIDARCLLTRARSPR